MQRPFPLHHGEHEEQHENGKDASMNAAREAHIEIIPKELVLVKGDITQNNPRDPIEK